MFIKPHVCSPNALVILFMKCSISPMPLPCVSLSTKRDLVPFCTDNQLFCKRWAEIKNRKLTKRRKHIFRALMFH